MNDERKTYNPDLPEHFVVYEEFGTISKKAWGKLVKSPNIKTIAFLYLLMRDKLPVGNVKQIMNQIEKIEGEKCLFTNKYLADYSAVLADKLTRK